MKMAISRKKKTNQDSSPVRLRNQRIQIFLKFGCAITTFWHLRFSIWYLKISPPILYTQWICQGSLGWVVWKIQTIQSSKVYISCVRIALLCVKKIWVLKHIYYTKLKIIWQDLSDYRPVDSCTCVVECNPFLKHLDSEYVMTFLMGLNESYVTTRAQILLMRIPSLLSTPPSLLLFKTNTNVLQVNLSLKLILLSFLHLRVQGSNLFMLIDLMIDSAEITNWMKLNTNIKIYIKLYIQSHITLSWKLASDDLYNICIWDLQINFIFTKPHVKCQHEHSSTNIKLYFLPQCQRFESLNYSYIVDKFNTIEQNMLKLFSLYLKTIWQELRNPRCSKNSWNDWKTTPTENDTNLNIFNKKTNIHL